MRIKKENNQVEYDEPPEYQIDRYQVKMESKKLQLQETDNKPFVRSNMTEEAPNYYNIQDSTLRVPSGYVQAKANLQTGSVTGCYYNTQSRVKVDYP